MQPVRGRTRSRGSQEFLLARGIAVQRRGGKPPARAVERRAASSPAARTSIRLARLGQDRVRGKWLVLCVLFLGSAVVYGAIVGGQTAKIYDALTGGIEHLAIVCRLRRRSGSPSPASCTRPTHRITAALGAGPDTMMLDFDTDAAKARLEAVPWIRHAQVMRLLPSTLQVVVEERTPLRRLAEQGPDLCGRRRGRGSRPRLARSLCELASGRGRGRGEVRRRIVRTIDPLQRSQAEARSPRSGSATGVGRCSSLRGSTSCFPTTISARRSARSPSSMKTAGCSSGTSPPSISGCLTG